MYFRLIFIEYLDHWIYFPVIRPLPNLSHHVVQLRLKRENPRAIFSLFLLLSLSLSLAGRE